MISPLYANVFFLSVIKRGRDNQLYLKVTTEDGSCSKYRKYKNLQAILEAGKTANFFDGGFLESKLPSKDIPFLNTDDKKGWGIWVYHRSCERCKGKNRFIMTLLTDDSWDKVKRGRGQDWVCVPCMEEALGRPLAPRDLGNKCGFLTAILRELHKKGRK